MNHLSTSRTKNCSVYLAGTHVRAAASVGGNLVLTRERALQSNLVPILIVLGASVVVTSLHSRKYGPFHLSPAPLNAWGCHVTQL